MNLKLKRLAQVVAAYAVLWLVTQLIGSRQVESEAMQWLIADNGGAPPSTASFEEWSASDKKDEKLHPYPTYDAKAHSPAPFIVVVDEGTVNGMLAGHGGRTTYIWIFGFTWRGWSRANWMT
jgi:hypothetical protein